MINPNDLFIIEFSALIIGVLNNHKPQHLQAKNLSL